MEKGEGKKEREEKGKGIGGGRVVVGERTCVSQYGFIASTVLGCGCLIIFSCILPYACLPNKSCTSFRFSIIHGSGHEQDTGGAVASMAAIHADNHHGQVAFVQGHMGWC